MQLAQSVNMRQRRIRGAQEGVYLPSKRREALEAGRFAVPDSGRKFRRREHSARMALHLIARPVD